LKLDVLSMHEMVQTETPVLEGPNRSASMVLVGSHRAEVQRLHQKCEICRRTIQYRSSIAADFILASWPPSLMHPSIRGAKPYEAAARKIFSSWGAAGAERALRPGIQYHLNYAHNQPPEHLSRAVDVARV
jgi:hypothetical protein